MKNKRKDVENLLCLGDLENEDLYIGSEALLGNDITDLLKNLSAESKMAMNDPVYGTVVTLGDEHEHAFI